MTTSRTTPLIRLRTKLLRQHHIHEHLLLAFHVPRAMRSRDLFLERRRFYRGWWFWWTFLLRFVVVRRRRRGRRLFVRLVFPPFGVERCRHFVDYGIERRINSIVDLLLRGRHKRTTKESSPKRCGPSASSFATKERNASRSRAKSHRDKISN